MRKPLPIGISDFKELINGGYTYVDKTLLIEEIVEKGTKVALISRLRRFGKTLNLSMLRCFFEKTKQDTSYLFKDLKIWQNEKFRALQGQFPVIFISLKDVKHATWEETFKSLQGLISEAFRLHPYLLEDSILDGSEKKQYQSIADEQGEQTLCEQSLSLLTAWLCRYHKKRVILLIDEYDTPAYPAYIGGYDDKLIGFLRNWLSGGLKDNSYLERGVLTGILHIAKESIFSGLNHITTFTILSEGFQDKFGLTEPEVKALLESYNLLDKWDAIRRWYNGYRIGNCEGIYNPWSVLNCIANKGTLAPYWVNTSDNALMKRLITRGSGNLKANIEELVRGGVIEKKIEEGTVFPDIEKSQNAIWSLLLYSGYLALDATPTYGIPCRLKIPNIEIAELYQSMILDWFEKTMDEDRYRMLLNSLISGDVDTFSRLFTEFMTSSVSIFDVPTEESEKIYHAFVLGLLVGLKGQYEVKSNRESGLGRYDVMLIPKNLSNLGIIFEFKKMDRFTKSDLEATVVSALKQIEEKPYAQELLDRGIHRILSMGFAFDGKKVLIRHKFKT